MSLTLYRRHSADCKVHALKQLKAAARKRYRECECVIWFEGTTGAQMYPRQSTRLRDWAEAEAMVRALDAEGKDAVVHGPTLASCIRLFIDANKHRLGRDTREHYERTLGRLQEYAAAQNKLFIREIDHNLLVGFTTYGLIMQDTSKTQSVARVRAFFSFAFANDWILTPLAEKIKRHESVFRQKTPYEDREVAAIFKAAEESYEPTSAYGRDGHRFRLLLELQHETGMRVGDSVRYNPGGNPVGLWHPTSCVRWDEEPGMWVYSYIQQKTRKTKTPEQVEVYLSDRLKRAIDECDWLSDNYPFADMSVVGQEPDRAKPMSDKEPADLTKTMSDHVYTRMRAVGRSCGVKDARPHRLRDTFCVRLLRAGVPIGDVSKLMNHSSVAVTERYYAHWVPELKNRLRRLRFNAMHVTQAA